MLKISGNIYSVYNNMVGAGLYMQISRVTSAAIKLKAFVEAQKRGNKSAFTNGMPKYAYVVGSDENDTSLLRSTLGMSAEKFYGFNKLAALNAALTRQTAVQSIVCILINCETDDDADIKLAKAKSFIERLIADHDLPVFLFVGVPVNGRAPKLMSNFIEPLFDYSQVTHIYNSRLVAKQVASARHLATEIELLGKAAVAEGEQNVS